MKQKKVIVGRKSYGSIPHFSISKLGPGEHHIAEGQEKIATKKARDRKDLVIVTEKLDGSNCGVILTKLGGWEISTGANPCVECFT